MIDAHIVKIITGTRLSIIVATTCSLHTALEYYMHNNMRIAIDEHDARV